MTFTLRRGSAPAPRAPRALAMRVDADQGPRIATGDVPRCSAAVGRGGAVRRIAAVVAVAALIAAAIATAAGAQTAPSDSLPWSPGPAPRPITLAEVTALAERNAPQVIQAEGQQRVAAASVHSAYAAFIPSVSLSAGATRQLPAQGSRQRIDQNGQVVLLPSEPWSYNTGLGANLELFDGGRRFFDLAQSRARATSANSALVTQRFQAVLAAKQQFFNVLAARETEAAARSQADQAEQQFRAAVARVHARNATRSDSLRAEIQVRSARLAVSDARTAAAVAAASLTRAVAAPYPVTAADADTLPPTLAVDDKTLVGLADNGPAVQGAIQSLAAARSAVKSTWTTYLPSLSASYSRGGSAIGQTFSLTGPDYSYNGSVRFALTLPVFNQWQRETQVTAAQVNERNAEAALADARLAAREGLTQALGAYRSAEERVASQTATLEAAIEDLRVQQQRYNVGGSTQLDVLTSQTQLDQARRDLIRARYDQRVAKAQLEALVGREL